MRICAVTEYGITVRGVRRDAAARAAAVNVPVMESKPAGWKPEFLEGGAMATIPQPKAPEPEITLPAGLTIRDGDRLRATVNDQDYAVSDVLPHLRAVEAVLMTATTAGRRVSLMLKLEEAAS